MPITKTPGTFGNLVIKVSQGMVLLGEGYTFFNGLCLCTSIRVHA